MPLKRYGEFQRVELGFDLDSFNQPIAYSGPNAWVKQIVQLCMLEPGTIASNPTIGVGIKRYDFLLEEDRRKLEIEINRQVPIFFPDMPFSSCNVVPPTDDDEELDLIYLIINLNNSEAPVVVVALKKGYKYIDFAIAM